MPDGHVAGQGGSDGLAEGGVNLHQEPFKYAGQLEKLGPGGFVTKYCSEPQRDQLYQLRQPDPQRPVGHGWDVAGVFLERVAVAAVDTGKPTASQYPAAVDRALPSDRYFWAKAVEVKPAREPLKVIAGRLARCWPEPSVAESSRAWH